MDVVDLKEFYASRLGHATRRIIVSRLRSSLRGLKGARVLGLGYCTPYLDNLVDDGSNVMAMMPFFFGLLKASRDVFLMMPLRVARIRLPLNSRTGIMASTSSPSRFTQFTIVPYFIFCENEGISIRRKSTLGSNFACAAPKDDGVPCWGAALPLGVDGIDC